ncbi:MAG: YceI family protein [Candidatus Rariloculaceae bacterium]
MTTLNSFKLALGGACVLALTTVSAEPVVYEVDPRHTYPSFEADHQGGLSIWRGKVERTTGTIIIDREAKTGSVDLEFDMDSINFGLEDMNAHAKAEDILDVAQFPTATYTGKFSSFTRYGDPTGIEGELTLHGITQPVSLQIDRFRCQPHHRNVEDEICGADATATFNRDDFDVTYGQENGHLMYVNLLITVEAKRVSPEQMTSN